jgi:tetratricopeptide (TPR) repeat protein
MAKLPGRGDPLMHSSIVRGWLEGSESGPWLLILDNLDEESTASEVVSSLLSGSDITRGDHLRQILVTTRNATIIDIPTLTFEILRIDRLRDEEGIELLDRILGKRSSRLEILRQLVQYLNGLPLAIAQAAAFMREVKVNAAEYLALYKENEENAVQLLDYEFTNLQRQPSVANAVTRTWALSFAQIRARNAPAADLLSLLSLLATGSVPIWILGMKSKEENDHRIEEAIEVLASYSLIQLGQDRNLYIHSLVQRATRSWLAKGSELERWKSAALQVVSTKFPEPEFENWSKCRELLVHAETVVEYPTKDEVTHIKLLYKLGRYNLGSGDYFRAEQQIEHAYSSSIQTHGETNEQTLLILSDLISCKLATGRWTDAENLGSYALKIAKENLVENDPAILTMMTTLAEVWTQQGRWAEAENLETQAFKVKHKVLGDEHPSTLSAMNNLAAIYKNQGRLNEAESLESQVLQLRKRVLGNEHPDTLVSLNNLAITYSDLGRYHDSEQLLRQVIDLRKRLLGPEHPDTVHGMHNLAVLYENQGRLKEAEELSIEVLKLTKGILGLEHPDTVNGMHNLAAIYQSQGRLNEAEELSTEVLELTKRILGAEHPRTLDSIRNLAIIYGSQGRLEEAEELMTEVLELRKRILGPEHPRTLDSIRNLAIIYKSQGRLEEAEELSTGVLELTKTKLR